MRRLDKAERAVWRRFHRRLTLPVPPSPTKTSLKVGTPPAASAIVSVALWDEEYGSGRVVRARYRDRGRATILMGCGMR